jgi:DnaJ-class molecular chaperone
MMADFDRLNYYEILQVKYDACAFEIRQAYKALLEVYSEDSLATYSLFTEEERDEILSSIENAFLTLIDADKRTVYDTKLVESGEVTPSVLGEGERKKAIPIFHHGKSRERRDSSQRLQRERKEGEVQEILSAIKGAECVSGEDLKRLRRALGIELEEVFELTKISPVVVRAIEQDDFAILPPEVYLKSFLGSYAEVLQLEANRIVAKYLKNMKRNGG